MLRTTVVGNYPKLSSRSGDVNIRRRLHQFDRGEITREELDKAFDEVTARVIKEQLDAGIDLPSDGQIRWDDIVTPFASKADGFRIGGLIRWFDNNVYYRKPVIEGPVKWKDPIIKSQYQYAVSLARQKIKVVLPAPFSFAMLSENHYYRDFEALLADLVELLRKEATSLIDAGAEDLQFDDPSLQYYPDKIDLAARALNKVIAGLKADTWITFYFGDISSIIRKLDLFQLQVMAADCVSRSGSLEKLLSVNSGKNICFGLLEARNIKLETKTDLFKMYERISKKYPDAFISPSCGLEFLPHAAALAKLKLLGESVREFNGGRSNA